MTTASTPSPDRMLTDLPENQHLGVWLGQVLDQLDTTVDQMGAAIAVHPSVLSRIISGKADVGETVMMRIATYLDVPWQHMHYRQQAHSLWSLRNITQAERDEHQARYIRELTESMGMHTLDDAIRVMQTCGIRSLSS